MSFHDESVSYFENRRRTIRLDANSQSTDRRRYERFDVSRYQSASLQIGKNKLKIPIRVLDASETGLSINVPVTVDLRPLDAVTIHWQVPAHLGDSVSSSETYSLEGIAVRLLPANEVSFNCSVRLERLIPEQIIYQKSRSLRMGTVVAAILLTVLIVILKIKNVVYFWYAPWIFTYSLIVASYVYARVMLAVFYREPLDHGYLPTVSVLISAKNEAEHIRANVESVFASRYPSGNLEVIVVDDGSTDATWSILTELKDSYPTLRIFNFPVNQGKRHGMAFGAEQATHEILVYVDSDCLVHEEGIYRLVQPLIDPAVGAVAGHIDVIVEKASFISKMEVVRYHISQRVSKAADSVFYAVTCCSGPFSAYRRVAVMRVLPQWLNQTFWGKRATFGDDRSLTNYILRTHRVVYHAGAHCATYVPHNFSQFFRQQLRWKKSWARESMIAARFMYRKHPVAAVLFYTGIFITLLSPLVALRSLAYLPLVLSISCVPYIIGLILINVFLGAVYFYYTRSRYWPYLMGFVVIYIFALCWQTYYAMVTIPRTHWGTRT